MPKVKPFFTHDLTVISNADFLALSGGSLKKGASFKIGDADALCMKITDDDKFLNASRHHDDDDDDDNQTGEIAGQGSVGDVEIGSFIRMKSSTGKKYDLIEIKSDAGSFWTFAGNIPGSDETLTVLHVFKNHKKAKYDKGLGVKEVAAVDDSLTTDEDTKVFGNVLTNDCAPSHSHDDDDDDDGGGIDHSNFRVVAVEGGTVGTEFLVTSAGGNQAQVRVSANGTVSVDPSGRFDKLKAGETDTVTFDYTLGAYHTVGKGKKATQVLETDKGTVTVTITGVNDAPVAVIDRPTTDEDNAVTISVLANDRDVEGDTLTVTGVGTPAKGTAVLNADNTVTYTPNPNFHGKDTFSYTISDGKGGTAIGTIEVTVRPVNDAPVAVDDSYSTPSGAPALEVLAVAQGVLGNDSDVDGDVLKASLLSGPSNGTLTLNENGTFIYAPTPLFQGVATFTYQVTDQVATAIGTARVTVGPAGPAESEVFEATEDTRLRVDAAEGVLANDPDVPGQPLTASLVTGPANGRMVMDTDGGFTYLPNANFNGTDFFTYSVFDGEVTIEVDASIEVDAVNDAPELTLLSSIRVAGRFAAGATIARIKAEDVDGDQLTFELVGDDSFLFRLVEVDDNDRNPNTHLLHLVARDRDANNNPLFPNDTSVRELAGADNRFDIVIKASDGELVDDLAIFFGALSSA